MPSTIYLTRHGQTVRNYLSIADPEGEKIFYYNDDELYRLTEEGRRQAKVIGEYLGLYEIKEQSEKERTLFLTSDLERSIETAKIIAYALGIPFAANSIAVPELSDPVAIEIYETMEMAVAKIAGLMRTNVDRILKESLQMNIIAVLHAQVNYLLLESIGIELEDGFSNCGLQKLVYSKGIFQPIGEYIENSRLKRVPK